MTPYLNCTVRGQNVTGHTLGFITFFVKYLWATKWLLLLYWVLCHFNSQGNIMAVGDKHVFPGFLTPVLTQFSFQSHHLLFSHASAGVRGENAPERKFTSIWFQTHNHQVMGLTRTGPN